MFTLPGKPNAIIWCHENNILLYERTRHVPSPHCPGLPPWCRTSFLSPPLFQYFLLIRLPVSTLAPFYLFLKEWLGVSFWQESLSALNPPMMSPSHSESMSRTSLGYARPSRIWPVRSLAFSPSALPLPHSAPGPHWSGLHFLQYSRCFFFSGSSHLLFLKPGALFLQISSWLVPSSTSGVKCPLLGKAFPAHLLAPPSTFWFFLLPMFNWQTLCFHLFIAYIGYFLQCSLSKSRHFCPSCPLPHANQLDQCLMYWCVIGAR